MAWALPNGKTAHSILHGRNSGGAFVPSVSTANAVFATLSNSWNTRLAIYLANGTQFLWAEVRDMTDPTLPVFRSTGTAISISAVDPALPQDVQLVLTGQASIRGRGARGRIYVPSWSTFADAGNGQCTSACQGALTSWGDDIKSGLLASSLIGCVAKPARQEYLGVTGTLHAARDVGSADVLNYVCQDTEFDTQRRRGLP